MLWSASQEGTLSLDCQKPQSVLVDNHSSVGQPENIWNLHLRPGKTHKAVVAWKGL